MLRVLRWVSFTALDMGKVLMRRGPGPGFTHARPEAMDVRAWDAVPVLPPSFSGCTAIVTGATRGIGREVAYGLAARGFHLALVGRDAARGQEVVQEIQNRGGMAEFHLVDMKNLSAVLDFGHQWAAQGRDLHVLVNNAGVMGPTHHVPDLYRINVLAPFALTMALIPCLRSATPVGDAAGDVQGPCAYGFAVPFRPTVVQVASSASLRSGSNDAANFARKALESMGRDTRTDPVHGVGSRVTNQKWLEDYASSKLSLLLLTLELRKRLAGPCREALPLDLLHQETVQPPSGSLGLDTGPLEVRACHPGLVYTDMLSDALPAPLRLLLTRVPRLRSAVYKSPLQGAATVLETALAKSTGAADKGARAPYFFVDGRPTHYPFDEDASLLQRRASELWTYAAADIGTSW